jgi:hypothetical protein
MVDLSHRMQFTCTECFGTGSLSVIMAEKLAGIWEEHKVAVKKENEKREDERILESLWKRAGGFLR